MFFKELSKIDYKKEGELPSGMQKSIFADLRDFTQNENCFY